MSTVAKLIYDRVCGTPEDIMQAIDIMIEDGEIDQTYFQQNEIKILQELDSLMFSCEICGWTLGTDDSSEQDGICCNCAGDYV